ncbi:kinase-like protein [Saccharata proteae CBS 121410]|uniref:Kinase-like protein n=1 Tax=Saccharata proteae CBS 121410 TaxID=1314787 RepID=A0A9P4LW61_9PEZI|nr:kinase-like protein [Saccharata proteae CBS 121410]
MRLRKRPEDPDPEPQLKPIELHKLFGRKVELLPDNTVVKSGKSLWSYEADALALAERLQLPVPRLLGFEVQDDGTKHLRMSFIAGEVLETAWLRMTAEEKKDIARQLRDMLCTMRSLPCTTGVIGACNGGPVKDPRLAGDVTAGPFPDEATFNDAFVLDLYKPTIGRMREALRKALHALPSHRIVFTHSDLHQKNIIVRDGRIVGLIDWEEAGWYPEYWEYVKFLGNVTQSNRDWQEYVDDIFAETYDAELVVYQAVLRWRKK